MRRSQDYSTVKEVLTENSFADFVWVDCRPSIADLFKLNKRCGIYVLYFNNDEFYVGQAIDVIRRYVQHTKTHKDIQEIAFKEVKGPDLNYIEAQTIKTLEQKMIRLRNISLTSFPKGETDLDLLIPRTEQNNWLDSETVSFPIFREAYKISLY